MRWKNETIQHNTSRFYRRNWQDVKDGIKESMINQFEEMWTQYYVWDSEQIEDMLASKLDDFIADQFRELFSRKDMKKLFMQEMMKQMSGSGK